MHIFISSKKSFFSDRLCCLKGIKKLEPYRFAIFAFSLCASIWYDCKYFFIFPTTILWKWERENPLYIHTILFIFECEHKRSQLWGGKKKIMVSTGNSGNSFSIIFMFNNNYFPSSYYFCFRENASSVLEWMWVIFKMNYG